VGVDESVSLDAGVDDGSDGLYSVRLLDSGRLTVDLSGGVCGV
jgi:hypothetical protein